MSAMFLKRPRGLDEVVRPSVLLGSAALCCCVQRLVCVTVCDSLQRSTRFILAWLLGADMQQQYTRRLTDGVKLLERLCRQRCFDGHAESSSISSR